MITNIRKIVIYLVINTFCFSGCSNSDKTINPMPPGEYAFSFGTGVEHENSARDWSPIVYYKTGPLYYWVKNDSVIETGSKKLVAGSVRRTLVKVNINTDAIGYQKLPKNYLDFELAGIYQEVGHPTGYYSVLYYSKKRHSLLKQYQVGLNNIDIAALYFENAADTINPFRNHTDFFKLGDYLNFGDTATMKVK